MTNDQVLTSFLIRTYECFTLKGKRRRQIFGVFLFDKNLSFFEYFLDLKYIQLNVWHHS